MFILYPKSSNVKTCNKLRVNLCANSYNIFFFRKNPISFLGISIGKFVEINVKSSIDNYFNKEYVKEKKDVTIQLSKLEDETSCSKTNDTIRDTPYNENKLNSKNSSLLSNQLLPSLSNTKKNKTSFSDAKNIKTMFDQMKNTTNSIVINQNVNSKKEEEIKKQNKLNMNSFFSKKLEIISPSKNIQNDIVERIIQPSDSLVTRKLEIVSPSKHQTNNDSVSTIELPIIENNIESTPTMLLCEQCNKMIDIEQYDEHIDHHIAMELSKSINATDIIRPINNKINKSGLTKKKDKCGQKRKHISKTSEFVSKKPCMSISSYFKPVLNP